VGTGLAYEIKLLRSSNNFFFLDFFCFSFFSKFAVIDTFFNLAIGALKSAKMPPFKSLPKSEAAAKGQGLASMTDFFSVNKKVGRPSRTSSNAGRPTGAEKRPAQALAAPPAEAAKAPVDKPKKLKLTRAYWSKGEGLKKMTDAIADWEPELQKPEDKRMSLHLFAEVHNIPYTTLQTHITTDDSKRIKLGSGVGAKRIIDLSTTDVIVDVLVRKDRANQGAGVGEALDSLSKCAPIAPTRSSTEPFGAPCGLASKTA
jgi:hypothetical protein